MKLADTASHSNSRKPVVLTTVPYYLPGYKGGGKLITVRNLVGGLSSQFRFKVLTADRDLGDVQPYQGVPANRWLCNENCEVLYASPSRNSLQTIGEQLSRVDYDVLHLNTVFSWRFGIVPLLLRRLRRIADVPTVIAPRGELAPAALAIKSARKKSFLTAARGVGLFEGAMWQATSDDEARDIRHIFGSRARIVIAPDLLSIDYQNWRPSSYYKRPGQLDIVFLSRITPKKNLHLAIEALRGLEGDITFRIAGPVDNARYWARCRKMIATVGSNIRTDYLGPIAISEIANTLGRHGLFFLPTANENLGYVILEALLAGCPVLISDQTPWRDLAEKAIGWDLPLARPDLMRAVLQHCVAMDAETHRGISNRARQFALEHIARDQSSAQNAVMFDSVLGGHRASALTA